jgi:TolA-binding protein
LPICDTAQKSFKEEAVKYLLGMILFLCFFLQACAHNAAKSGKRKVAKTTELAEKSKSAPINNVEQSEPAKFPQPVGQAEEDELSVKDWTMPENDRFYFELSGEKHESLTSHQVYDRIIEKYRSNDFKALEAYTNLLLSKYPQSRYADNALYLQGLLAFSIKSYAKSLESFQKIINLYPNGNKAVSALFAKGMLYKKLNLNNESENVLSKIKVKYPGSPESLRADAEIKILKQ